MTDAYFQTRDGIRFHPTDHARGPWDEHACHAGPPTALMVRASEQAVPDQRFARITVEIMRPIPMAGFSVTAEVKRAGRSASLTTVTCSTATSRSPWAIASTSAATVA